MTLYIEGELIPTAPVKCEYTDYAAGRCDVISMVFNDIDGDIRSRQIEKGDTLQALAGNVDTGVMYISDIQYSGTTIYLKALSMPVSCFATKNYYWDHVGFKEMIEDVIAETDLELILLHPLEDVNYIDVTRIEESPINFIARRLMLEGFGVKVHDSKVIIYNEKLQENKPIEMQLAEDDFLLDPEYSTKDSELIAEVENCYKTPEGAFIDTVVRSGLEGRIQRENIAVTSLAESRRFSNGIMREANKYEFLASGKLNGLDRQAGQTVWLVDAPYKHDGLNYIYMVRCDLVAETQYIYMRKPIDGDY